MKNLRLTSITIYLSILICLFFGEGCGGKKVADLNQKLPEKLRNAKIAIIDSFLKVGNSFPPDQIEDGLWHLRTADSLSSEIAHDNGNVWACFGMSRLYSSAGDYKSAELILKKSWSYCLKSEDSAKVKVFYFNALATNYDFMGQHENAVISYHRAISEVNKQRHPDSLKIKARIYSNLSQVYKAMLQMNNVIDYLTLAEKYAIKADSWFLRADILCNFGDAQREMGKLTQAKSSYIESAKLAKANGYKDIEQFLCYGLGRTALLEKDYNKAIAYFDSAAQYSLSSTATYTHSINVLSGYYKAISLLYLKRYNLAEVLLQNSIVLAERAGFKEDKGIALSALATIYEAKGDLHAAIETHKRIASYKDSIFNADKVRIINEADARYKTAQKDQELFKIQLVNKNNAIKLKNHRFLIAAISGGLVFMALIALLFYYRYKTYKNRQFLQNERIKAMQQQQEIERLKASLQGAEQERVRIAKDLHEGIISQLSGVQLQLSGTIEAQKKGVTDWDALEVPLHYLSETTSELRKTAHNLMPYYILSDGLEKSLRQLCNQSSTFRTAAVTFQSWGDLRDLDRDLSLSLYRITQELLQNAFKHSDATEILVQLDCDHEAVRLTVEDNGKGFDLSKVKKPSGIGLQNIKERLMPVNGKMEIESDNNGTSIYIEINYPHNSLFNS